MFLPEHLKCTWGSHYVSIGQRCAGGSRCHRLVVWGRLLLSGRTLPPAPLCHQVPARVRQSGFRKRAWWRVQEGWGTVRQKANLVG